MHFGYGDTNWGPPQAPVQHTLLNPNLNEIHASAPALRSERDAD